jgi:hypothetical protein
MQFLTYVGPSPAPKQFGWKAAKSSWMKERTHGAMASSYNEHGAPEHVGLADRVVVAVGPGSVIVVGAWDAVMDWMMVTVTVDGMIAGFDEEVDREVVVEVEKLAAWLEEEDLAVRRVEDDVFDVVVAVSMQVQALRIFEDDALHPELIADGVAIAMFVV